MSHSSLTLAAQVADLLGEPVEPVRMLPGGTHAETALVAAAGRLLVARRFPEGDDAVQREVRVLERVRPLGVLVPELVAHRVDAAGSVIVTTLVDGGPPASGLDPEMIAREMAAVLARVHALDGVGLPAAPKPLPPGDSAIARRARIEQPDLGPAGRVMVHNDFWCGNALWRGDRLTGVVDWSDARWGPRGVDVAWCRQDLVLLGAPDAADVFLRAYEDEAGILIADIHAWDLRVGAYAEPVVETWAPNYDGIGRVDVTANVLRRRLDEWNLALL